MALLCTVIFVTFGLAAIAFAAVHEYTWWKRRGWKRGRGVVIGFTEECDDGTTYRPEIQFEWLSGQKRFVCKYGSNRKPKLGSTVDVLIDESGESGVQVTVSNRLLFTLVPIAFGLLFIIVGINIKPLAPAEQGASPHGSP